MKFSRFFVYCLFAYSLIRLLSFPVFAQSCDTSCGDPGECEQKIKKCQEEWNQMEKAKAPHVTALNKMEADIAAFQARIKSIEADLVKKAAAIAVAEKDLSEVLALVSRRIAALYRRTQTYNPLLPFLTSTNVGSVLRAFTYQHVVIDEDKKVIAQTAVSIRDLQSRKSVLEKERTTLAVLKEDLDKRAASVRKLVGEASAYQTKLSSAIAALSAKQQELLAAKFASAPMPLLAYTSLRGCSSDIGKSSNFSPRYGFFSLGVPNKTGLNQYGAKGRAEAGQGYEEILRAYYKDIQIIDYGTGFTIKVNGTNPYGQTFNNESYNIEEYLKHLYEMPANWDSKALQAQAIAARSYALARTNNGQHAIPPDESGQVVKKEPNAQSWIDAVEATKGKVLAQNGSPVSAWYSSTHGGVVLRSGQIGWNDASWTKQTIDTPSGSAGGIGDLKSSAYDRQSPWFYCDWGYRGEYNNTAWLKGEEVADIVNAYILWSLDNSAISHLSQTDKPTSDTWSPEKVRQEIQNKGEAPISSISSISVDWDASGITRTIRVNGKSFDAQKFKNLFNLRAPANIQIKPACQPDSSLNCNKMYALYDVVKE